MSQVAGKRPSRTLDRRAFASTLPLQEGGGICIVERRSCRCGEVVAWTADGLARYPRGKPLSPRNSQRAYLVGHRAHRCFRSEGPAVRPVQVARPASPRESRPTVSCGEAETTPRSVLKVSRNGDQSTLPAGQAASRDLAVDCSSLTWMVIFAIGLRQS